MTCQAGLIEMARPDRRVTHGKRARRHESRVNNQPALTPFGRPDTPARDDALAALARLAYPFGGFPFVGDESRSVAQEQSTFDC